jgi:hypothetical protein
VSELLPGGRSSIPALAEALLVVSRALDAEMGSMPAVEVRSTTEACLLTLLRQDAAGIFIFAVLSRMPA